MSKQFLFVGGEADGHYITVYNETKAKAEIPTFQKIDFRKVLGIVSLNTLPSHPRRTETYHRKRFGDVEYFCLEGMTDDEIIAKIPK